MLASYPLCAHFSSSPSCSFPFPFFLLPLLWPLSPPILFHYLSLLQSPCCSLVILGSYDLPWSFLLFQTSRYPHEGGKKVEAKSRVNGQSWFFIHLVFWWNICDLSLLYSISLNIAGGWERGADSARNRSRTSRILVRDKGFLVKLFSLTPLIDHG